MIDLGLLMDQARGLVLADRDLGLRPSQLRIIAMVPEAGISQRDLAEKTGMSQQGAGQFVAGLVAGGYLTAEPHPDDRRVRLVRRTPLAVAASRRLAEVLAMLDARWAAELGDEGLREFRATLTRLADLGPVDVPEPPADVTRPVEASPRSG